MRIESHIASVMSVTDDKDKMFAIRVKLDEVIPGESYPELAKPLFSPNFIKMPKPGQQVEVIVRADDPEEEAGEGDMGVGDFPEFCYYTGRIFDLKEGQVPAELKTNYPKRSGWWMDDGTIIYMDETNGSKEIALVLAGGQNFVRIKEQELLIQFGAQIIKLDSAGFTVTDTTTKIGGAGANNPLVKGTETIAAMTALFSAWTTAIGNLAGSSGLPADVLTYAGVMVTALSTVTGTLTTWASAAHFQDGR